MRTLAEIVVCSNVGLNLLDISLDLLQHDQSELLCQLTCVLPELLPKHHHLTVAPHELHPLLGHTPQPLPALDGLHLLAQLRYSVFVLHETLLQA